MITCCLVEASAWLMHLFMVQVEVQVDALFMDGSSYFYSLVGYTSVIWVVTLVYI